MVMICREVPSNSVAVPKAPVMQLRQLVTVGLTCELSVAKLQQMVWGVSEVGCLESIFCL